MATSAFVATHFGAACGRYRLDARQSGSATDDALPWEQSREQSPVSGRHHTGFGLRDADMSALVDRSVHRRHLLLPHGGERVKNIFGYDDSLDAFGVHRRMAARSEPSSLGVFANSAINPIFGPRETATGLLEGNAQELRSLNQLIGVAIAWTILDRRDADHSFYRRQA